MILFPPRSHGLAPDMRDTQAPSRQDHRPSGPGGLAAALTVGAGLVHAAAAGNHGGDRTMALLFAACAVTQVLVGVAVAAGKGRPALVSVAVVNVACAAAWAASRTTGLPFVAGLAEPEAVGAQDLTAAFMAVGAAGASFLALVARPTRRVLGVGPLWVLAVVPTLVGMTAGHVHGAGDHHGVAVGLAADPIFAGADTSHATEAQLLAAKDLIERTRDAAARQFPDEDALVRAGYRSIGDGFPVTPYEHFIQPDYLHDGRELDPEHIESIVLQGIGESTRIVSTMYILERGKTMADVPDIAGALTTWHDHQNLCWDATGTYLKGFVKYGRCFPAGELKPTPPMLHVWLQPHECGPFAGLEGHGGGCDHEH
ncbi:MAG TPA: hypothetical protein VHG90_07055 [Acidimicrobiales bacterium]|nr:hypothetical protein [Acidimicrobiales bacterium]